MPADARTQMAGEAPVERARLIRVAGTLDRAAAARLLRLIDAQCALLAAGHCQLGDLLVDLENVRSFEPGGLEATRRARHSTAARGVRIHLVGCSNRFHLLPLRARQILGEFRTFPTVEVALAELARATTTDPARTSAAGRAPEPTTPTPAPQQCPKDDRSWRETVESNVSRWWEVLERRAGVGADPINPELVFHELSPQLPDNAMITSDSGSAANWYARHLRLRRGMRATLSGTLATMGPGLPYATGAKFAHPDRPVLALVGDGAMQMNGINELITVAQYFHEWPDRRFVVGVLNNQDLNQVTWELRAMAGSPDVPFAQHIPDFPYAGFAASIGLAGIKVTEPDQVHDAWERALAADRPCVVEFVTDAAVPPIPPHASLDQMENTAAALLRGDPEAWDVVKTGVKSKVQDFLPGR